MCPHPLHHDRHYTPHLDHIHHGHAADFFSLEIPSINVNLDSILDEFRVSPCRSSLMVPDSPDGDATSEEEGQSTTL